MRLLLSGTRERASVGPADYLLKRADCGALALHSALVAVRCTCSDKAWPGHGDERNLNLTLHGVPKSNRSQAVDRIRTCLARRFLRHPLTASARAWHNERSATVGRAVGRRDGEAVVRQYHYFSHHHRAAPSKCAKSSRRNATPLFLCLWGCPVQVWYATWRLWLQLLTASLPRRKVDGRGGSCAGRLVYREPRCESFNRSMCGSRHSGASREAIGCS